MRERCGVRNGRKSKVRLLLNPYCSGEVPDDIARDLVVLQDIALLLDEVEAIEPSFGGMERLWRGGATDVPGADDQRRNESLAAPPRV